MDTTNLDVKKADAAYKGFPSFAKWKNLRVDLAKWEKNISRLDEIASASPEVLEHARKIVRRYAAIETGAVEKLYETNRGFTWTVAVEMTDIQSLLADKGEKTKRLIESQFKGYDYILDLATGAQLILEAWIRELHKVLCEGQETYSVYTSQGPTERPMPKGEYKKHPNHVRLADGGIHSYAPVDMVGAEMNRLLKEIKSPQFNSTHPVIQAAYSHYCFVYIHPFSDGNGRVARAIASVFLYRSNSIPFLVLAEDKDEYIDCLETADKGNYQPIVDFTIERCFNAVDLLERSIKAGIRPDIDQTLEKLKSLYQTKGGFTQEQVDKAATILMDNLSNLFREKILKVRKNSNLELAHHAIRERRYGPISENHRPFIKGTGKEINLILTSKNPARATVATNLQMHIPKDCDKNDDLIIDDTLTGDKLHCRINEILPVVRPSLKIKLDLFAKSTLDNLGDKLIEEASKSYQR